MFKQTISTHPNNIHRKCNPYPCSKQTISTHQTNNIIYRNAAIHTHAIKTINRENAIHTLCHVEKQTKSTHPSKIAQLADHLNGRYL